jgi:hypothetical protein
VKIDREAIQALNLKHADNPQEGDFWHEFLCPIAKVHKVSKTHVWVERLTKPVGDSAHSQMTREEFARWIRYDSIPDHTWADVQPGEPRQTSGFSLQSAYDNLRRWVLG